MYKSLWNSFSKHRQKQSYLLVILMVITSFLEIIGVGSVLPFLGILINPEMVFNHSFVQWAVEGVNSMLGVSVFSTPDQIIFPVTLAFISAILLVNIARVFLLFAITRFSFAVGADLSINIYRRTLHQEYVVHINRNSSQVINGITNKTNSVIGIIQSTLTFISSTVLLVSIIGVLFFIDIRVTLFVSIGFGTVYGVIIVYTRSSLKKNSDIVANNSTLMLKSLQEGLGGIRDVIIDNSQEFYCNLYRNADLPLRKASGDNVFIGQSPRYLVEAVGIILIVIVAYLMTQRGGYSEEIVPILGVFALGAQRLLPSLQQAYSSYSAIKGSESSVRDVIDLLEQPLLSDNLGVSDSQLPMSFDKELVLKKIGFQYSEHAPWILKDIDLKLSKGTCTGFVGMTGSGKSTLIDIIMGLIPPSKGEVIIDKVVVDNKNRSAWRACISHVPQNIYLSDSTVKENIAFGVPKNEIDQERVIQAAKNAQIACVIEKWKDGYDTYIGEQGVRLSGGQRQRTGIARAFYKQSDILVFDEATSALDRDTEKKVMYAINNLKYKVTVLVIAHRLTTLKNCDQIFQINKNGFGSKRSYKEIINDREKI
jgi:ATP-binding cassette, subfamily B, bacterial PglK